MTKRLIREHSYTPDFRIIWAKKANGVFYASIYGQAYLISTPFITTAANVGFVEIKPAFSRFNSQREFSINQKWLYQRYGTFCQKIIIANKKNSLFDTTFTPAKYLLTEKTKKLRKLNYRPRTLSEYANKDMHKM